MSVKHEQTASCLSHPSAKKLAAEDSHGRVLTNTKNCSNGAHYAYESIINTKKDENNDGFMGPLSHSKDKCLPKSQPMLNNDLNTNPGFGYHFSLQSDLKTNHLI